MSAQRDPVYWLGWDCEVHAVARGEISGIFLGKQVKYIAKQNHFKEQSWQVCRRNILFLSLETYAQPQTSHIDWCWDRQSPLVPTDWQQTLEVSVSQSFISEHSPCFVRQLLFSANNFLSIENGSYFSEKLWITLLSLYLYFRFF